MYFSIDLPVELSSDGKSNKFGRSCCTKFTKLEMRTNECTHYIL